MRLLPLWAQDSVENDDGQNTDNCARSKSHKEQNS